MSFSPLTHATTRLEPGTRQVPTVRFFLGPSNPRGRHLSIGNASKTEVLLFKSTYHQMKRVVGRFLGRVLPVLLVGRNVKVLDNDDFIPKMNGCSFIHREVAGHHVLVRIYSDDLSGKEARKRLEEVAKELEAKQAAGAENAEDEIW